MLARETLSFRVSGTPQPKGSTKSFVNPRTGRVVTLHDNECVAQWTRAVGAAALSARGPGGPWSGAVAYHFTARMPRPKSVSVRKRLLPIVKPDGDKLERALWDALTGVIYVDDAQVVEWSGRLVYADGPGDVGVEIVVARLDGADSASG